MTVSEADPDSLSRRALVGHVATTLSASGVTLAAIAGANILIGRMLGVTGQGQIAAATLVPMIVGYAGELALPVAAGYLINVERERRREIIATARLLACAISAVLAVVCLILVFSLPFLADLRVPSLVFVAFIPLNLFHRLHLAVLQADLRLRTFNVIRISGALTYLAILLVFTISGTGSILRVVLALLTANVVWLALSASKAMSRPWLALDRPAAADLFRYGSRAYVGNVSTLDALRLDQLVLALFLPSTQLGLYVAAMTIVLGNRALGTAVGALCFPLASRGGRGRNANARRQFRLLLLGTGVSSCVLALVEVVLGGRLLGTLFGAGFRSAGSTLRVLAVGSIFMNLRQVSADWLRGCGRFGVVAASELAGIATLGVLAWWLWDGTVQPVAWAVSIAAAVALCSLGAGVAISNRLRGSATALPTKPVLEQISM